MSVTYATNSDVVLYTGQQLTFASDINKASISNLLDNTRVQAYNYINNELRGRTAIPATDPNITTQLKNIEKNFVIGWSIGSGLTTDRQSDSNWPEFYTNLAEKSLKSLSFPATYSAVTYESYNTGNGTISISKVNDEFARTEQWELIYGGNEYFTVFGSKSGRLSSLKVGDNYPNEELLTYYSDYDDAIWSPLRWNEYPFYCVVSAGSTAFVLHDRITFWTFKSSFKAKITDSLRIRRAG